MRVALATIFGYPHVGGLSTHMTSLLDALRQISVQAEPVSPSQMGARMQFAARMPASMLRLVGIRETALVYSQEARARILKSQLSALRPDVVAAQDVVAARVAAELDLACVLTVHGYYAREAIARGSVRPASSAEAYLLGQERLGYRVAEGIVTVDQRLRHYVMDESGRDDVVMIQNFVPRSFVRRVEELRRTMPRRSGVTLLCPRRLTAKNGAMVAAKAMRHLPDHYRLEIVGDGEQRAAIQSFVDQAGLDQRVRLLGSQNRESTARAFARADIVLIPSLPVAGVEEATSISALEAMAVGLPTIASAIGGLTQIIRHGESGLLVPAGDEKALASAIRGITDDLAVTLGEAARQAVEREHSASDAAAQFLALYQAAPKKRRADRKGRLLTIS